MTKYAKFKEVINESSLYPNSTMLIYKHDFKHDDIAFLNKRKQSDNEFIKLPLVNQNNKALLYWNNPRIINMFVDSHALLTNSNIAALSNYEDGEMLNGFIFSEIENTLALEGVHSTRAQIEKLKNIDYEQVNEQNDIIVKNMLLAYEFVKTHKISEQNIYALYNILARSSLNKDEMLLQGHMYRHDSVAITTGTAIVDYGAPAALLPKLMNDLLTYIKIPKSFNEHLLASHIIHYYIIMLHPYFDYNGRLARVLSFWYNYAYAPSFSLLLVNEAINHKLHKKDYYTAISNSRKNNDDITFFLEFIGSVVLKHVKVYVNYFNVINKLKGKGVILKRASELALKYVLLLQSEKYFDWKDYKDVTHDDFSKQYYLKLLNTLVDYNILTTKEHKKVKLFKLNIKAWDLLP